MMLAIPSNYRSYILLLWLVSLFLSKVFILSFSKLQAKQQHLPTSLHIYYTIEPMANKRYIQVNTHAGNLYGSIAIAIAMANVALSLTVPFPLLFEQV